MSDAMRAGTAIALIREAVAKGFRGTPKELAALVGVDPRRVYNARSEGVTWAIPDDTGEKFNSWTIVGKADPSPSGVSRRHVECVCGLKAIRETGDIKGGRSKSCGHDSHRSTNAGSRGFRA